MTVLAAGLALSPAAAVAQRPPPSPEQRIDRLERQVNEMQRRVYPKGKPADTAGFSDDPAATQSSVLSLDQRLDALERQMADMLRQTEENGNRLRSLEAGIGQLKSDQDQRIQAIEQRMNEAAAAAAAAPTVTGDANPPAAAPVKPKPKQTQPKSAEAGPAAPVTETATAEPASDPGEDAYTQGFHQWEAGKYDDAISTLKSFVAAYPKHRRASFAQNLLGRAYLDEGKPSLASMAFYDNYKKMPEGERAPDSLLYLGQALTKLNKPADACKVYDELNDVYGAKMASAMKGQVAAGRSAAKCK